MSEELKVTRENYNKWREQLESRMQQKARIVARQLRRDYDDVKSLLDLTLLEAIDKWDESKRKNCKFTSFFWTRCNMVVLNETAKVRINPNKWGRRSSEPALVFMGDLSNPNADTDEQKEVYVEIGFQAVEKKVNEYIEERLHRRDVIKKLFQLAKPETRRAIVRLYRSYFNACIESEGISHVAQALEVSPMCIKNRFNRLKEQFEETYGSVAEVV